MITADHGNADVMRDADGQPVTAHSLSPVPILIAGRPSRGGGCTTASSPTSPRRSASWPACRAGTGMTGSSLLEPRIRARDTIHRRTSTEDLVNPFLAIGQIIVSIALIAAILLQARGTGLSGTFGGDSAVYRSRRGVERRLWQFTIILLVLFVVFSLASFLFAPTF